MIHFCVIDFICLLDSRDLDCFDSRCESRNDEVVCFICHSYNFDEVMEYEKLEAYIKERGIVAE